MKLEILEILSEAASCDNPAFPTIRDAIDAHPSYASAAFITMAVLNALRNDGFEIVRSEVPYDDDETA